VKFVVVALPVDECRWQHGAPADFSCISVASVKSIGEACEAAVFDKEQIQLTIIHVGANLRLVLFDVLQIVPVYFTEHICNILVTQMCHGVRHQRPYAWAHTQHIPVILQNCHPPVAGIRSLYRSFECH
jgi:hypothetical protein